MEDNKEIWKHYFKQLQESDSKIKQGIGLYRFSYW